MEDPFSYFAFENKVTEDPAIVLDHIINGLPQGVNYIDASYHNYGTGFKIFPEGSTLKIFTRLHPIPTPLSSELKTTTRLFIDYHGIRVAIETSNTKQDYPAMMKRIRGRDFEPNEAYAKAVCFLHTIIRDVTILFKGLHFVLFTTPAHPDTYQLCFEGYHSHFQTDEPIKTVEAFSSAETGFPLLYIYTATMIIMPSRSICFPRNSLPLNFKSFWAAEADKSWHEDADVIGRQPFIPPLSIKY